MAVPKKLPNLLFAVVLLCVTFAKAAGQCHTETWDNAPDKLKDKLPGFVCQSRRYQICEKGSVLSDQDSIGLPAGICGVKLNCSGKGVTRHISITLKHDVNDKAVWIDVSNCGLEEVVINPEVLYSANIDVLDMSGNAIQYITTDMFSGRTTAKTLLFRNNGITSIVKKPFSGLQVSKLDISGNLLQNVNAKDFSDLIYLQTLLLSRNKINKIEASAFGGSNNLSYLDLSHNILENIPANVFTQLRNLTTLIVSHNKLFAVGSNSFQGLSFSLLDLSNNPLRSLDPTCFNKTSVTKIDISSCEFEQFPQDTVRFLDENLRELNLSGNQITAFPTVGFDQDFLLRSLDLSHNLMEGVGCCWLGDKLKFLYLHGNAITTIERCLFTERMFTLTSFSLAENPLDCCQMYWLKEIASASDNLLDSNTAMCGKPKGISFLETEKCKGDSSSKTFKSSDIIVAVLGTFFATLCLIGIVCALVFVVRRKRRRSQSSESALRQQIPLPDIPTTGTKKAEMPMYENVQGVEPGKEYQKLHEPFKKASVVKTDKKTPTKSTGKGSTAARVSTIDDMEVYQELEALPKDDKKKGNGSNSVHEAKASPTTGKDDAKLFYGDTAVLDDYEDPAPSTQPGKKVTTIGKRSNDVTNPKGDQKQNQSKVIADMYENTQKAEHPTNTKTEGDTFAKPAAKAGGESAGKERLFKGPANTKRSSSTTGPLFKVTKREPDKQRGGVVKQLSASYDARL